MPYSDAQGKDTARDWYEQIHPRTVVDVGAGAGTYARLLRGQHPSHWTAVEAWGPYIAQFDLEGLYDRIIVADARHLPPTAFDADLTIAADVLEHMPHGDAVALLNAIRAHTMHLIVSIPVLHLNQDAVYGNPFERHIDHWTANAMRTELGRYGHLRGEWVGDVLAYWWWSR